MSSIYTLPFPCNNDLPHVESRSLIRLPFCLSTSEPLIFTTFSKTRFLTRLNTVLNFNFHVSSCLLYYFPLHYCSIIHAYTILIKKRENTQQIHKCAYIHAAGVSVDYKLKSFYALDLIAGITQVGHFTFFLQLTLPLWLVFIMGLSVAFGGIQVLALIALMWRGHMNMYKGERWRYRC